MPDPADIEWARTGSRLIDQRRLPGELVVDRRATVGELCDAIPRWPCGARRRSARRAPWAWRWPRCRGEPLTTRRRGRSGHPADGGEPGVGRATRRSPRRDPVAEAVAIARGGRRAQPPMGALGAALVPEGGAGAHPLQRGRAGAASATAPPGRGAGRARGRASGPRCGWTRPGRCSQGAPAHGVGADRSSASRSRWSPTSRPVADGAGEVDCVVVGADRIAANGDVANKVGTYSLAVLAHHHGIPFYVAAPTLDHRPGRARPAPRSPSSAATPTRCAAIGGDRHRPGRRRREPGLRHHPRRPRHRLHHRGRSPRPAPLTPFRSGGNHAPFRCIAAARTRRGGCPRASVASADMLIPARCAACGGVGPSPCGPCIATMRRAPALPPPPGVDRCASLVLYIGAGREVVARVKYRNASRAVAWLASGDGHAGRPRRDRRGHVGAHHPRPAAAAGFDQGRLLARAVARRLDRPCRPALAGEQVPRRPDVPWPSVAEAPRSTHGRGARRRAAGAARRRRRHQRRHPRHRGASVAQQRCRRGARGHRRAHAPQAQCPDDRFRE